MSAFGTERALTTRTVHVPPGRSAIYVYRLLKTFRSFPISKLAPLPDNKEIREHDIRLQKTSKSAPFHFSFEAVFVA